MSKPSKFTECKYTYCIAATINNKRAYYIRALVFIIGFGAIIKSSEQFNFINITLLLVPALTDNYYEIIKAFQINSLLWFDKIVKFINIVVMVACVFGFIGVVTDTGAAFRVVSTALLFGGLNIPKEFVAAILLLDFFETLVMGVFVPSKFDGIVLNSEKKTNSKLETN